MLVVVSHLFLDPLPRRAHSLQVLVLVLLLPLLQFLLLWFMWDPLQLLDARRRLDGHQVLDLVVLDLVVLNLVVLGRLLLDL